jgi:hypothetical protein
MKARTFLSLVIFALLAAVSPTAEVRGGRGGFGRGGFGGGHFGGGGGFHFGGAAMGGFHSSRLGRFGGVRYSFGARPTHGRPVYVRPRGTIASAAHSPALGRQQGPVS